MTTAIVAVPGRATERTTRFVSLDAVRGLAVGGMVIVENLPGPLESFRWWRHAVWHGLTIADVVFPLFLVLVGAGMAQWLKPPVTARTMRRLALRSLALVGIGLVVFGWWGEGGGLDSLRIPGVLQRIGIAGLLAGVVIAGVRRWWAIAIVTGVLLVAYGWTLTVPTVDGCRGIEVPACTVPGEVDAATFGSAHLYRDGAAGYDPEGLPSTAGAVASVLLGWLAGDVLRRRRIGDLVALAGVTFVLGVLWESSLEVNKRLWTPSFVLITAAISIGLIAVAHATVDRSRVVSGFAYPLVAFGRNALLVYVGQHVVGVWLSRAHVGSVTASTWLIEHVAQRWVQPPGAWFVYALGMLAAWTIVACALHAKRWYVTL